VPQLKLAAATTSMELLSFHTMSDADRAPNQYCGCFFGMTDIAKRIARESTPTALMLNWHSGPRDQDAYRMRRESDPAWGVNGDCHDALDCVH